MDSLKKYHQKRNFKKTKEPLGKKNKTLKKFRFVVQHHLARRDHYDFRLEWNGTLKSWAVPKGPSYNTRDKRLAIHVEDHPIEYRNFEGTIPKGQYGGGTVMIWDEGYWEPLENPQKGFQAGSLKFRLKGSRLKGKWTLVHFKEDNWLLMKEQDDYHLYDDIHLFDRSIRTNRTMEEIEKNEGTKKRKNSRKEHMVESITISNPNKIIFDHPKITKYDLALYYQKVSKRMLPFLENRLISTIRSPNGIYGEKFFKKHFDPNQKGMGQVVVPSEKNHRNDYYYIKDVTGLISEVQMNGFEFHGWGSNVKHLNHPDMMVFDFDPDEDLSFSKVRQGVRDLKSILDDYGLVSFLKTSGGKGYHVVVPIHSIKTWKEFRDVAQNIAKLMEMKWPDRYTSNVRMEKRKNKIFIDWIRNTKGATSVLPYSVRVRPGARVSMPIRWSELDRIKPNEITIKEAMKRLRRKDPWEGFFEVNS